MDYGDFRNPNGGYNWEADVISPIREPKQIITVPKYGSKGTFVEKFAKHDGVGNYHVNHFIGYFNYSLSPTDALVESFIKVFYSQFPMIFSINNIADVSLSKYIYNGKITVEFKTGGNRNKLVDFYINPLNVLMPIIPYPNLLKFGGMLHSDWVSFEMMEDNLSFYGSTLKRNWLEDKEKEFIARALSVPVAVGLIDKENALKFAINFIEVNQHHFLAGRRSWTVGYNKTLHKWFVETMTIERSSQCEYNVLEKTGALREQIVELWIRLIVNFSILYKTPLIDISKSTNYPEYKENYTLTKGNVAYKIYEGKDINALLQIPWISNALKRHPGLKKGW